MLKVKNLTPHVCNIVNKDGSRLDIRPETGIAPPRVSMEQSPVTQIETQYGMIDYTETVMGEVKNLPEMEIGVILIVSRIVYDAANHRPDLRVPGPALRDGNGAVIGAMGLSR